MSNEDQRDPSARDSLIKAAVVSAVAGALTYVFAPGQGKLNWFGQDLPAWTVVGAAAGLASVGTDTLHYALGNHVPGRMYNVLPYLASGALLTGGIMLGNGNAISLTGGSPGSQPLIKVFGLGAAAEFAGLAVQDELLKIPLVSSILE